MIERLLTEDQAVEKAQACVKREFPDENLKISTYKAELEKGGVGEMILELNEECWLITFPQQSGKDTLRDDSSDDVIVVVDAVTGETIWLPNA